MNPRPADRGPEPDPTPSRPVTTGPAAGPLPRVVLIDSFGSVGDVASALDGVPVDVSAAQRVPTGPGIVALLLGPGTALTAGQVAELPDLRIVAATSAGSDHIDVDAVTAAGAWVTTAAGYSTGEVAEHTIAFVLGLLRGVTALDRSVRAGRWNVLEARPRRVAGSVLGLVGFGRTGQAVAERATALGMRVAAYGPTAPEAAFHDRAVRRHHDLPALLAASDVVSLHLPLAPSTERIIDAAAFAAMRPGAYLVNVSRGGLVDHQALADALARGHLAGAALDVLPVEPPPADDPVLGLDGVVVNPHAAWYSPQARTRPFRMAAAYVADVLSGRAPAGAVAQPTGNPVPAGVPLLPQPPLPTPPSVAHGRKDPQ